MAITKKSTKKSTKKAIKKVPSRFAMTEDQKQFITQVIRPVLIQLAIDNKLPVDMNEIGYHFFEKAVEQFNEANTGSNERAERLTRCL